MRTWRVRRCGRGAAGAAAFLAAALVAAACVTDRRTLDSDVPAIDASAVVIPFGAPTDPAQQASVQVFDGILRRVHDAYKERDLPTMQELIGRFRGDGVPDWARDRFAGMATLALGLQFELHAKAEARLSPAASSTEADGPPHGSEIGDAVELELSLPPLPGAEVTLGGQESDAPVAFSVLAAVTEEFVDGSRQHDELSEIVRVPRTFVLRGAEPLRLPVRLDFPATGSVRRQLAVFVELLPGYVGYGDQRAPVRLTSIARAQSTQWPRGYWPIQQQPAITLQNAMQIGDAAHFPHVRLAAEFAPRSERAQVCGRLIDWVRLGRADQALVAMAALRALDPKGPPVGDRDGWLAWWQSRR